MRSRWHAEGVPLIVIQRQLGHTNLGITSIYLQGINNTEIIDTVHARRAPMSPSTARSRHDAATGGGGAHDFLAAGPVQIASQEPGVASGLQSAPIIAKQQPHAHKQSGPFARRSDHALIRLSCARGEAVAYISGAAPRGVSR